MDEMRELSADECLGLLRSQRWGRVAMPVEDWPAILPVNYACDDHNLVFRTGPGVKIAEAPMRFVAFEVDGAAPDGEWAWSVLVQGPAFDITNCIDEVSRQLQDVPIDTWAPGDKPYLVRIRIERISGRTFGPVPAWSLAER